jgi:hypothetical protein
MDANKHEYERQTTDERGCTQISVFNSQGRLSEILSASICVHLRLIWFFCLRPFAVGFLSASSVSLW